MQIYMRRYGSKTVAIGTDDALFGFPLPADSSLNFMKGEFHILPQATQVTDEVSMYGIECWILQTDAFADFQTIDALWNTSVPKDDGIVSLDASFGANTANFFEPGLVSPAQIFGQELLGPERVYQIQKMISIATAPATGFNETAATFFPSDFIQVDVSKKYLARDDSAIVWGFSNPALDALTASDDLLPGITLAVDGFYVMKYMEDFIDKAMVDLVGTGLTETGAESPFEDIMDFILALLESAGVNSATGGFRTLIWDCVGKMTYGVRVPGSRVHTTLGPDGQA